MKRSSLLIALTCVFFSCKKDISQVTQNSAQASSAEDVLAATITATPSDYWNNVFTRYGGGWTGGDAAYSIKLPDGRSLWLWGDSFLDTVYPNRTRPVQGFIHNQMVTTDSLGGNFTTYYGGTKNAPRAYFEASNSSQYYWPTSAFYNDKQDKLYVMMIKIKPTSGSFKITSTDVAILDLPSLKIKTIQTFYTGDFIDWSSTTLNDDDGYVYLYGVESGKYNKFIHVARTSTASPFKTAEYYDGANWVSDVNASARIQAGVSESFSVFKDNGTYYLVSQGNLLSADIYIWKSSSPAGPFNRKKFIYTTPYLNSSTWTYNATAHTELSKNGQLLIGYCMNTTDFGQLFSNVDTYRPYFIYVKGWK